MQNQYETDKPSRNLNKIYLNDFRSRLVPV